MAGHISFNPLSMTSEFLKNKSDPSQPLSHVGEASITRTLNHNGPLRPNGFKRSKGTYVTAYNAPRTHKNGRVRVGTSAKNAMSRRNEIAARDFAYVNRDIESRGLGNYYENGNANLPDPAMVGMRRSRVRNQKNGENVGLLLENNVKTEGLSVVPRLRYASGKNIRSAHSRSALKGSRNKGVRNAEAEVQRAKNALAANNDSNTDKHLQLKDAYANAKAKLNSLKVGGSKRKTRKNKVSKNRNGTARH
jgi:hypothetical protein